jgi:hypothetical protein
MSPKHFEAVTRKYGSVESPSDEKKLTPKPAGKFVNYLNMGTVTYNMPKTQRTYCLLVRYLFLFDSFGASHAVY